MHGAIRQHSRQRRNRRVDPAGNEITASKPCAATASAFIHMNDGMRLTICRVPLTSWNSLIVKPGHTAVT
jgi:hypothetical protein